MAQKQEEEEKVRLDKWLWAARFFKTRALAKAAIESGKVHHRGERCKPGKEPRVGDELQIRAGFDEKTVVVQALSVVRRGAPEAQALYTETEASIAKRETPRHAQGRSDRHDHRWQTEQEAASRFVQVSRQRQ